MNVDEGRTLRNFIVGASNRKAIERIQQSFRTRRALPPILLLGPSGVGKSHLLQAVANRLGARGKRVLAVRAHEFRERYIAAIRAGTTAEFRSSLRSHDALVVDDLEDLIQQPSVLSELSVLVLELLDAQHSVYFASVKLWPTLLDQLALWDADVVPVGMPSLAQRRAALIEGGRRKLTARRLLEIARSVATIGEALATLEREIFARELATD
jgi:chromosomal replication initiation ATPase DnaA